MRHALVTVLILIGGIAGLLAQTGPGALNIYYIDTEGGQSTLFVGPTGESLLVDTGNAGDRDLGRIVETLKTAGVKQIDHMWTTHYHGDHVGSLLALAKQIPISTAGILSEFRTLPRHTVFAPGKVSQCFSGRPARCQLEDNPC